MHHRSLNLDLLLAGLLAAGAGHALAGQSIITVTTTDDVIASDGECSLREAIVNANNNSQVHADCDPGDPNEVDYIYFDLSLAGATIVLGGVLPTVTEDLRINGPGKFNPDALTIDAGGASRILRAQGSVPAEFELRLDSLTLTGGETTGTHEHGGAVLVENANLILRNARVIDSATLGFQAWGGGIAVIDGVADLRSANVSGNSTAGNLAAGGGLMVQGELGMEWTTVEDNHTTGSGAFGGGAAVGGNGAFGSGSTIAGNTTAGMDAHGGGLAVTSGGMALINSTVSGNRVDDAEGGGIWVNSGETLLRHATVAFNRNSAGGVGGVVVSTNSADDFDLQNSVVAQEEDSGTACNKLADDPAGSVATDNSCTGASGVPLEDFNLLPLADNGSAGFVTTRTHAFFWPSFLLNLAGDCNAQFGVVSDQRGQPRPGVDTPPACDIGAFELQGPIEPELQITPATVDFGTVRVGQSGVPVTVTLTNTGNAVLDVAQLPVPGFPFTHTGGDCPTQAFSLNPGQSCTLEYGFSPLADGNFQWGVPVESSDPDSPHAITLSGEAADALIDITPGNFDFGGIAVGQSSTLVMTVENPGTQYSITVHAAAQNPLPPEFDIQAGSCGAFPFSLDPGEECQLDVIFTPSAVQVYAYGGQLEHDASAGFANYELGGQGLETANSIFEDRFEQ